MIFSEMAVVNIALAINSTTFTCYHSHAGLYTEIWVLTPAVPQSHTGIGCPVLALCWGLSSSLKTNACLDRLPAALHSSLHSVSTCHLLLSGHILSIFTMLEGIYNA